MEDRIAASRSLSPDSILIHDPNPDSALSLSVSPLENGAAFSPFPDWKEHANELAMAGNGLGDAAHVEGIITPPAGNSRSSTPLQRPDLLSRRNMSSQNLGVLTGDSPILIRHGGGGEGSRTIPSPSIPTTKENLGPSTMMVKTSSRSSSISPRTAINMPIIEIRRASSISDSSRPRGRPYSSSHSLSSHLYSYYSHSRHFLLSLDQSHAWLALYLTCAISQTISNKTLLRSFFPFPWLLTVCQMIWGTIGTMGASKIGAYRTVRLSPRKETMLYAIGLLFSIELLASNVSLRLVAVPYHLSVRALAPLVTLLFSVLFFHQHATLRTSSCLLLVALGVAFTSHNLEIISLGSILTIVGMLLSSAKSIITSRLLFDKYKLHPLDLLSRMSLLGIGPGLLFALGNGELGRLWHIMGRPDEFTKAHLAAIAMNGALSFVLFVVQLAAEKRTKPPMMAISSHVAQAVTVIVAVILFGLSLSLTNFIGVGLTLSGGVLYARNDALDMEAEENDKTEEKLLPD